MCRQQSLLRCASSSNRFNWWIRRRHPECPEQMIAVDFRQERAITVAFTHLWFRTISTASTHMPVMFFLSTRNDQIRDTSNLACLTHDKPSINKSRAFCHQVGPPCYIGGGCSLSSCSFWSVGQCGGWCLQVDYSSQDAEHHRREREASEWKRGRRLVSQIHLNEKGGRRGINGRGAAEI